MNTNSSVFARRLLALVKSVNYRQISWYLCNRANNRWRAILLLVYECLSEFASNILYTHTCSISAVHVCACALFLYRTISAVISNAFPPI